MQHHDLTSLHTTLQDAAKAMLVLRTTLEQREARMRESFDSQMQSLHR